MRFNRLMKAILCLGMCSVIVLGSGLSFASTGTSGSGNITATVNSGAITVNAFGFGQNNSLGITQNLASKDITVNNSATLPFLVWVNASDTSGYSAIQYIDVYMHYAYGSLSNSYNTTPGENMNIYLNLTNNTLAGTATHTAKMMYPNVGSSPTALLIGSYYKYLTSTSANFTFELFLGPQIHNASVTADKFAWVLNATIKGDGATASAGPVYFGVNNYGSVSISQDSISGTGAPSSSGVYSLGSLTLHYSVNNNYTLSLEATNLTGTVGAQTYTFYKDNIGIYNPSTNPFNGSDSLSTYYKQSTSSSTPTALGTGAAQARPFNMTESQTSFQISLFGNTNVSYASAQTSGEWETITVDFVFQVPIGTVAASYNGKIVYYLVEQGQTFP